MTIKLLLTFVVTLLLSSCGLFLPTTSSFYQLPNELVGDGSEFRFESSFSKWGSDREIEDDAVIKHLLFGLKGGISENHPCRDTVQVTGKGFDKKRNVFWIEGKCDKRT